MDEPQSAEIMFFLGAGASVPAGLKDVVTVIPDFLGWLKTEQVNYPNTLDCIKEIITKMEDWYDTNQKGKRVDIETLLEIIERLESSFNDIVPEFFRDRTMRVAESCIKILSRRTLSSIIKNFIQKKFQEFETYEYYEPLKSFVSNYKPLLVFTTNYDLIIEQFSHFHTPRIKYTDFFVGTEWSPERIDPVEFDIILHKLHGSVSWTRTEGGRYVKLTQKTPDEKIILITGEKAVPLILYPGKKLEYIEPTLELLELLKKSLNQVKCCFAIGYKFGDDHIAKLFRYSASRNEDLIVFLISPSAYTIYYEKLKRHVDDEFAHGFMHESFSSKSFSTTLPTGLEGRVICLPYKFQNIFPSLLDYYENLKRGLHLESILSRIKGKLDPLTLYSDFNLIDCLECYLECEYFDRIEAIVDNRTNGWNSIIRRVAEIEHQRYRLHAIYAIFLKRFFNLSASAKSNKAKDLLTTYLTISQNSIKTEVKNYSVNLWFLISDIRIQGAFIFELFTKLEEKFNEYAKVADTVHHEILVMIQKAKGFFERWNNGQLSLEEYLELYVDKNSQEYEIICDLIGQQEFATTKEEADMINDKGISDIIDQLEKKRLS